MTLQQYYQSFKSLSGTLAGIVSCLPFLSKLLPENVSNYIFPPLGIVDIPARIGTFALALATTYLVYFWKAMPPKSNSRRIVIAILLSIIFHCIYLIAYLRFVRTIDIPTRGTEESVSVGYRRTPFAIQNFSGVSDWEMLRQRGVDEEQIWVLWTTQSVLTARGSLLVAYSGFVLCLVAAFSWGVLQRPT